VTHVNKYDSAAATPASRPIDVLACTSCSIKNGTDNDNGKGQLSNV
jgi:hypothetical protein